MVGISSFGAYVPQLRLNRKAVVEALGGWHTAEPTDPTASLRAGTGAPVQGSRAATNSKWRAARAGAGEYRLAQAACAQDLTSGLGMIHEMCLPLDGWAGPYQLTAPRFGLMYKLNGFSHQNVADVAGVGRLGEQP